MADQQVKTTKHVFGHCMHGPKDLNKHKCPHIYQRFYIGPTGRSKNKKPNGVIWLDEWAECVCLCHTPEDERPKPKKKAVKRVKRKS